MKAEECRWCQRRIVHIVYNLLCCYLMCITDMHLKFKPLLECKYTHGIFIHVYNVFLGESGDNFSKN